MSNYLSHLIISFFLFSGCSFISKKVESLVSSETEKNELNDLKISSHKINNKNLYCFENNKPQILLEDESTLKYFYETGF